MNRYGLAGMALGILAPAGFANNGETDKAVDLAPLQEEMININFKPGSGVTFDGGDSFSLNMRGGLIFRYEAASQDSAINGAGNTVNTFDVRSARLMFGGHIFDRKTRYMFSIEASNDLFFNNNGAGNATPVKDAYVERDMMQMEAMKLVVGIGQMRTLYGRETNGTEYGKAAGEFTLAGRSFSGQRNRGIAASLVDNDDKWRVNLGLWNSDVAGGSNYANEDAPNWDNELSYSLSARFDPAGSLGDSTFTTLDQARSEAFLWGVGAGIFFGNQTVGNTPGGADVEQMMYNFNFAFKTQGWGGLAELYISNQEIQGAGTSVDDMGWSVLVNYSMENGWTFGGQVSSVANDAPQAGNFGIRPVNPTGTSYAGEGTTMEYGVFVSRDYNNVANHRVILEFLGQSVDQETPSQTDNNLILRATYVLVF